MINYLSKELKLNLAKAIEDSNSFVIVTTGRAGTDFLQSCYDNHEEIATTSEKSQRIIDLILKYKDTVLNYSTEILASLAVESMLLSFAPQLNIFEDCLNNKIEFIDKKGFIFTYI